MDDKRRRKVDIALKAYPGIKRAVLQLKSGNADDIETETLEQLSKLKPDPEEVKRVFYIQHVNEESEIFS